MKALAAVAVVLAMPLTVLAGDWKDVLPAGATGYVFGGGSVDGFQSIQAKTAFDDKGAGFAEIEGISAGGGKWPDGLTGAYVHRADGKEFQFKAKLPNGEYLVWLCAGKVIKPDGPRHFLLQAGETKLLDETPDDATMSGTKYLGRFFLTAVPSKPESLWSSYVDVMYPGTTTTVKVTDGVLSVKLSSHFLSALVAVPADKKADFEKMVAAIRQKRIEEFSPKANAPKALAAAPEGTGEYVIWTPTDPEAIGPLSVPSEAERKSMAIAAAGAPGQRVIINLAVLPNADLGRSTLELSDLKGPGTISAKAIQGFFQNHFYGGRNGWGQGVLAPTLTLEMDKGITRSLWLWLSVPDDAKPGLYKATFTFKPAKGKPSEIPVSFEVYPFHLDDNIPMSCGYWGGAGPIPAWMSAETRKKVLADRLAWMRSVGLTSITVSGISVKGLNKDGTTNLSLDPSMLQAAKAAGMARNPFQALMLENWMGGVGRTIARMIPAASGVYDNPGAEFKAEEFRGYCLDAAKQYKKMIDSAEVPVVVTAVDEPRETEINSWNRNFADTVEYLKIIRQAGLVSSVDPMADSHGITNTDYTPFVDYCDVLSTHGWALSAQMMRMTVARKKVLWLYNVGVDRYSWGFYNWRAGSTGRWEWQLHDGGRGAAGNIDGYPNHEAFNPLAGYVGGLTQEAPLDVLPGGFAVQPRFMTSGQGVTDFTYLYTLEQALRAKYDGDKAGVAKEARDWLDALRRAMPEFPQVKGLASAADSAKVGMGIEDSCRLQCAAWQSKVADYLKRLGAKGPGDPPPAKVDETPIKRRALLVEAVIRGTHLYQCRPTTSAVPSLEIDLPSEQQAALLKTYDALLATPPEQLAKWVAGDDHAFDTKAMTDLAEAKITLGAKLPVNLATNYIAYRVGAFEPSAIRAVASLYQMVLEGDRDGDALQSLFRIYQAAGLPIYMGELGINWGDAQFLAMGKELSQQCWPSPISTISTKPEAWQIAARKLQNWGEHWTGKITAATYAKELMEFPAIRDCAQAIKAMPAQKVCVIGHSFTMSQHWSSHGSFVDIAAEVIKAGNPNVKFVNFQAGGLRPGRALKEFADKAIAEKPDKVLLVQVVENEQQQADLKTLIGKLTAAGAKVYFLDGLQVEGNNIVTYAPGTVEAAKSAGATIVEVQKLLKVSPFRGDFVCLDGVHMNPVYHKVMATEWVKFLAGKRQAALGEVVDPAAEPKVASVVGTEIAKIDKLPSLKNAADWTTCAAGLAELDSGTIEISKGNTRIAQRIFLGRTDKDLYVLIFNCEPDTDRMVTNFKDPKADRGKTIYSDDDSEMFIATNPKTPNDHYQLMVNSAGALADVRNKTQEWDSGAAVTAKVIPSSFGVPGAWLVEMVIPFDKLGGAPAAGATWNMNFTRIRQQKGIKDWKFTWSPMPDESFHHPDKFKSVTFK